MLERLEADADADPEAAIAVLAAKRLDLDEEDLRGALRRAMLLLAAGGDPRRELELDGRAVSALAAELASVGRSDALPTALAELRPAAGGLPRASAALDGLLADPELAWRWIAAVHLADELSEAAE